MQSSLELQIFTVAALIFSVIIHEVAHGYAAEALGDPTAKLAGRLTLNPLPHIDLVGSVLIPAMLVLTQAGVLFGWAKPVPYNPYNLKNQRWGVCVNLSLGLFNLIPFPPLDGFTVIRGLLPLKFALPFREFEERLRRGGIFTLLIFLFVFTHFFAGPFYSFIFSVFRLLVG